MRMVSTNDLTAEEGETIRNFKESSGIVIANGTALRLKKLQCMSTIQTSALMFNHWNINRQYYRCEKYAKKVVIPIVERNRTQHSILTSSVIAGMLFRRSGYSW